MTWLNSDMTPIFFGNLLQPLLKTLIAHRPIIARHFPEGPQHLHGITRRGELRHRLLKRTLIHMLILCRF